MEEGEEVEEVEEVEKGEKDGETVSGWSGRKWSCLCRPEQDGQALQSSQKNN